MKVKLIISSTWDGNPVPAEEQTQLTLELGPTHSSLTFVAPFAGEPAPATVAGACPKLWEHEVVELFLLGSDNRYLELEFGPYGHYLAFELRGRRNIVQEGMPLEYRSRTEGVRWEGLANFTNRLLPPDVSHLNAYAIRRRAGKRLYTAFSACPGNAPDFHRLDCFVNLADVCGAR